MLLCSIADIRSRSESSIGDDAIGALIENVSDTIEDYVGAWLAPRPSDPSLTTTLLFDVETTGSTLRLVRNGRAVGIRTLTALGLATGGQPEAGGIYTAATLANVLLRPRPSEEGPATKLILTTGNFYRGFNAATVTGSFGPAVVSARTREATIALVQLILTQNPGLASQRIGDWEEVYATGAADRDRDSILSSLPGAIAV